MKLLPEDLEEIFLPKAPILEIVLRGFIVYLFILFILRLLARRTTGEIGAMDLIFILLVTEAASRALGDHNTIGDGLILLVVFMIINFAVNKLMFHSKFIRRLFEHQPIQIIKDGKLIMKNVRKELLTKEDLLSNMREHGIDDIKDVKKAFVESEGNITFIEYEKETE